MNFIFFIL